MSYSDLEHFGTILSGCESINAGDYKSGNSIYAQTVLKLHLNDAGMYAGQEGFVDSIKKGAKKTKEWVEKFIKALKEFIANTWNKVVNKAKGLIKPSNKEIAGEAAKTSFGALKTIVNELDRTANGMYSNTLEEFGFKKDIQDMANLAGEADKMLDANTVSVEQFWNKVNKLLVELKTTSEKLVSEWKRAEGKVPKDNSDPEYNKLHKQSEDLGWSSVSVGQSLNYLTRAIDNWSSKIEAAASDTSGAEYGKNLAAAVEGGNKSRIRSAFVISMDDDKEDDEVLRKQYLRLTKEVKDLWEDYDVSTLAPAINKDSSTWDESSYIDAISGVNVNFSAERIKNVLAIRKHLNKK